MPPLTRAYVEYLEGELADRLDAEFHDDETPIGEALRNVLAFHFNVYCIMHDLAGKQAHAFVQRLPFYKDPIENAVSGRMMLRQTHQALTELLGDDVEFLESFRGEHVTDDETDQHVREEAREYAKDTEVSADVNDIVRKTAAEGEATEKHIADAAYNFQDAEQVEHDIALSMRDQLPTERSEPTPLAPAARPPLQKSNGTKEEAPPERVLIQQESYLGQTPSVVHRRSTKWLADAIIAVCCGSLREREHEFPRIAPLIDRPELGEWGSMKSDILRCVAEIRDMVHRLRPPLSERYEELQDLMERLRRPNSDGSSNELDTVRDVLEAFRNFHGSPKDDEYGLGLNDWKSEDDE